MFEKYYKKNKDVKFNFYAYSPPGSELGDYTLDKRDRVGLVTVDKYREYKEVGFNVVMSGTIATYYGEEWETSMCKQVMDVAYEAGIDKYIVGDQAFYELSKTIGGLIGEGKKFKSEDELDEFIRNRIKGYSSHPAFYGIYLIDEPYYYYFESFGQIFKSLKRVNPKVYIYCNLLPLDTLRWMDERYPKGGDLFERRSKYLNMFLDETECDYIMYDDYPFSYAKENKVLYIRCLQNAASICRDRNKQFSFVAQSFSMMIGKNFYYYLPNEEEMRYQLNLLLGFGVKEIGFFTYMPHGANSVESFPNDGAMITREGKKMEMYYITQKLIKELWQIIPVTNSFEYRHSAYDVKTFDSFLKQLDYALNEDLERISEFNVDKEGVLINELYDKEENQYLYRVINVSEIRNEKVKGINQKTRIKFKEGYNFADVYEKGEWKKVELIDDSIEVNLLPGESCYILVY